MCQTPVVPFLAKSALFIAGLSGKCPALRGVIAYAVCDERVAPERRNLILEKLFRRLPALPEVGNPDAAMAFAALSDRDVAALSRRHVGHGADALKKTWDEVVGGLDVEVERDLARRCAVLLTELFRRRVTASRVRLAAVR